MTTVESPTSTPQRGYSATKDQLLKRLRRIEGQVRGVQGMVEDDRYCIDVLTQISAVQAALDKVALGLLDDHARHCARPATSATRPTSSWPRSRGSCGAGSGTQVMAAHEHHGTTPPRASRGHEHGRETVSWAIALERDAALPHRLCDRRGPRHDHRHRARLVRRRDDRALDHAGVLLRLLADVAAAAARRHGADAPSSRSRWPPTRSRSRSWRSSTTRSCC